MNIKNEEIEIPVPVKKDIVISFLLSCMSLASIIVISFILGSLLNPIYFPATIYFSLGVIVTYFVYWGMAWKLKGNRSIVIDTKYLIIFEKIVAVSKQKVYRLHKINNLTIDKRYKYNLWQRIKSFWTKDGGGCIKFYYEDKLVKIGNGLTVKQAENLLKILKEKQFLKEENFR